MQVATGFVGKALEELSRQTKTKGTRRILLLFCGTDLLILHFVQTAPNKVRPAAEIDDATGQAFIHRNMGFASERIAGIEAGSVSSNPLLVSQRFTKCLPQRNPAIFHGVMRIHFEIAIAPKSKVHDRMLGEEREHVIKERNPGLDRRLPLPVDFELE